MKLKNFNNLLQNEFTDYIGSLSDGEEKILWENLQEIKKQGLNLNNIDQRNKIISDLLKILEDEINKTFSNKNGIF